ncbi:TrkH family potassium uptake protein [Actinotalea sp. BY-33]|uniref:TrkH family potassium uptake protein n=1 Tax=Actinotalea soli TaxID=2819234 RepID=A0A939LWG0_9CELL|nr:potassium transporter TrkG [Actinotalea soli]MBO1753424.1 TrkH family potassium uptake protein [Actinotalea soli]
MVDQVARQTPARLALTVFASVIAVFTALLLTPQATASGRSAPFVDALFTATSAVCVTGLVTVDTGTYWSGFGQTVILVGIKVGGLGVMTLASLLGVAVSRHMGLTQRMLTARETRTTKLGEVGTLLRTVILASTAVELAAALVLVPRFLYLGYDTITSFWWGIFYAISAFNNAGFVPNAEGMVPFTGDALIEIPVMVGVFIGSLGFPVILNVARTWSTPRRWALHTKLTILTSGVLFVVGALVIGASEWNRTATYGDLSWSSKLLNTVFASVNTRSGGFSTVPVSEMNETTWLVSDALMFVGGGSASTAGGLKVTTLAVLFLAIRAEARGDRDLEAFGRRLQHDIVRVAIAVSFMAATIVLVATLLLLEITGLSLDVVLFETISAFATCGLSTGITADLPDSAKYILSVLMFVGRTGPMTLAGALALRDRQRVVRLPEERPIVG